MQKCQFELNFLLKFWVYCQRRAFFFYCSMIHTSSSSSKVLCFPLFITHLLVSSAQDIVSQISGLFMSYMVVWILWWALWCDAGLFFSSCCIFVYILETFDLSNMLYLCLGLICAPFYLLVCFSSCIIRAILMHRMICHVFDCHLLFCYLLKVFFTYV